MKVHAALGNGFQEVIYQRALEIELQETGLKFAREVSMPIYYKEKCIGERRVDFCQTWKCSFGASQKLFLKAYNMEVGLLINFGAISLEFKRIENQKYKRSVFPINP